MIPRVLSLAAAATVMTVRGALADCPATGPCPATVTLGSSAGVAVSPNAPGVAMDWWVHEDGKYGYQWGNASILTVDLTNPEFTALATGLGGSVLRLGGSPIDSIVYDVVPGGQCARGTGTPGGSAKFTCSQVGKATYGCLTGARWRELLGWAKATGLRAVLGLNACNGRANADSPMDFTNIQQLLNFTVALPKDELSNLVGFEFGNEVLGGGVSPQRWAEDAATLAGMIKAAFAGAGLPQPPLGLIGPDHYSSRGYSDMLKALKPGTLSSVSYHNYPQCVPTSAPPGMVLSPSCLASVGATAATYRDIVAQSGYKNANIWMGEGAMHTATGGDFGHAFLPTFTSSFYYAWITAALPLNGVTLGARQTLIGGNYGLLNRTTFKPQPDYFVAYMYRYLLTQALGGGTVRAVNVTSSVSASDTGLQAIAFRPAATSALSEVLVFVNIATERSFDVTISGGRTGGSGERSEWHFAGAPNAASTDVTCNGKPMTYPGGGAGGLWDLDALAVKASAASTVTVAPASVVYVAA